MSDHENYDGKPGGGGGGGETAARYDVKDGGQPWELEDLLDKQSDAGGLEEPEDKSWKKYAKMILPHVGLMILSCLYVVSGAVVFYHLEKPNEVSTREISLIAITDQRELFLNRMWNLSRRMSFEDWEQEAVFDIDNITRTLFEAFDTHYITERHLSENGTDDDVWTFTASVFFASTLLTTIGYGNLVPSTSYGRLFCICYGLLGVPLILITVADFGKFLSEHIVWLYTRYLDAKKRCRARCMGVLCSARERRRRQRRTEQAAEAAQMLVNNNVKKSRTGEALNELEKLGLEGYVAIPMTLVLVVLVGYIALGALLVSFLEGWRFFDSFYFSFVTMTTIGFGDLVPTRENYFLLYLLYILVGLAVTTMCIDLVGIQYIRKIHYFGRAIKDARFALVNVGGKMVQVGDLVKYAAFLHKKYGIHGSKMNIIDNPLLANPYPDAFTPREIASMRYIDYLYNVDANSLHNYSSDFSDDEHYDQEDTDDEAYTYRISSWMHV